MHALLSVGQESIGKYEHNSQSSVCLKTGGREIRFREHSYPLSLVEASTFLSMLSSKSPFSCFSYSNQYIDWVERERERL